MTAFQSHRNRLLAALIINLLIALAEFAGGMLSGSLALISDSVHNLADGLSLFISFVALKIASRPPDRRNTFGFKRAEILSAFLNSILLVSICIFLIFEAIRRFSESPEIEPLWMGTMALFGLLANVAGVFLLKKPSAENINIRSAYLHLVGDALSSVAVIAGAIMLWMFGWQWIDPLITLLISLYILTETWSVIRQSVNILMMGTPPGMSLTDIQTSLENIKGIRNIHHMHLWRLNDNTIHFEGHIELGNQISLHEANLIRQEAETLLRTQFHVHHITLQPEPPDICIPENMNRFQGKRLDKEIKPNDQ